MGRSAGRIIFLFGLMAAVSLYNIEIELDKSKAPLARIMYFLEIFLKFTKL